VTCYCESCQQDTGGEFMGEKHTQAAAGSAEALNDTAEVAKTKPEWQSPILTKLPAVEAGGAGPTGVYDGSLYS